jgi:hypothetical protein
LSPSVNDLKAEDNSTFFLGLLARLIEILDPRHDLKLIRPERLDDLAAPRQPPQFLMYAVYLDLNESLLAFPSGHSMSLTCVQSGTPLWVVTVSLHSV